MSKRTMIAIVAIIVSISLTISVMGTIAVVSIFKESDTVATLKKSADRGECRAEIANKSEDRFHHDVGDLFDAAQRSDLADVKAIVKRVRNQEAVNDQIKDACPSPIGGTK